MSKKVKIIIISVVSVVVVGGLGIVGYKSAINNKFVSEEMPVDLYTIPGKEKVLMTGKIVPMQSEKFTIPAGYSEIDKMNVKDGQVVKKGDLLFTCKNVENLNELSNLNTSLANKKKQLGEAADEEVKAAINAEISELNSQISNLNKSTYKSVYAPFAGKIYKQDAQGEGGETIPTVVLETQEYYIKTQTNEMDIVKLSMEQEVEITITSTKDKVKGKISLIGDRPVEGGDTGSEYGGGGMSFANFDIKVTPDAQEKLKNGFGVQVVAQYGKSEYKIPLSAIIEEEGKSYVFKIVDDVAVKTEVNIKEKTEEFAVIDSGIGEEDTIARDTMDQRVVDGQNIYGDMSAQGEGGEAMKESIEKVEIAK